MTRYMLRQAVTATLFAALALAGVAWLSQSPRFVDPARPAPGPAMLLHLEDG